MKPYYQDDFVTLYNADCREVLPMLPKCDLLLTDPPYGNGESSKYGRRQLGVRKIEGDEDFSLMEKVLRMQLCERVVLFLQWRTMFEAFMVLNAIKLPLDTVAVWDKKNCGLDGGGGLAEQWEGILFAGDIKYSKFGGNVFTVSREYDLRKDSPHPHKKPLALILQILGYLKEYKTILDPFAGSGTTLVAAKQLGRKAIGIELEEKYCEVAAKRCSQEILPFDAPPKPQSIQLTIGEKILRGEDV